MSTKLLQMLIASAGPKLAAALAEAILGYLQSLASKTETEIDDDILRIIVDAISNTPEDQDKIEQ